jgi:hypothetical protein
MCSCRSEVKQIEKDYDVVYEFEQTDDRAIQVFRDGEYIGTVDLDPQLDSLINNQNQ